MFNNSNKYFQFISGFLAFGFTFLQGIDWAFKKYSIDGIYFNIVVSILLLAFVGSVIFFFFRNKIPNKRKLDKSTKKTKFLQIGNIVLTTLLLSLFLYFFTKGNRSENLLNTSLPEINAALDRGDNLFVFTRTIELLKSYPENELLQSYLKKSSYKITVETVPENIDLFILYGGDTTWTHLGKTPSDSVLVASLQTMDDYQIKLATNGHEFLVPPQQSGKFIVNGLSETPLGYSFFPGLEDRFMWFPGIYFGKISYAPFAISKTEVANKEYQKFLSSGGYTNPEYWDFPMDVDGTKYTFEKTILRFTDKHGQSGPANWSYGKYPENQGDYPVTGISWFEARAYARYREQQLPNVFQWLVAAELSHSGILPEIVNSNLKSTILREVNDPRDENFYGIKNIAGNVKEWATNPHGEVNNKFSILGGAYYDNDYNFNDYYSTSPFDRSIGNGTRLVTVFESTDVDSLNTLSISYNQRDILAESDVSDEVFEVYRAQFDYNNFPLDVKLETLTGYEEEFAVERFQMPTPYKNDEPLHGYIVYSKNHKGKLKPIIQFPGARSIYTNSDEGIVKGIIKGNNYLLKEGYAIIHPAYYSTYNRKKTLKSWWANESEEYKDTIIKIGKDYKRSIDYIQTRKDFDFNNLSYMGLSWGSIMSNTLLAIDDRVKIAFICVGGLQVQKSKKEIEPAIFIRRIKIPVMHITGKLDGVFEYENSQIPMQKLLGTPKTDQKMIVLEGVGHGIPKDTIVVNHLQWLKKYEVD